MALDDDFDDDNLDSDNYLNYDPSIFGEENSMRAVTFLKDRIALKRGHIAPIKDYIKGGNLLGAILYLRIEFPSIEDSDLGDFLALFNQSLEDFKVALSDVIEVDSMTKYLINDLGVSPEDADLLIKLWQYPLFDLQYIPTDLKREYLRVFKTHAVKKQFPAILHREIMGKAFEIELYLRELDSEPNVERHAYDTPIETEALDFPNDFGIHTPNTFTVNGRTFEMFEES